MRYIVGQSLSELIGKKPMDEQRAARYLEQVARAVDFAHTHDVLHRDLKPRNILIDGQDRAVVTDFEQGFNARGIVTLRAAYQLR